MIVVPAIDLRGGRVVRLKQGRLEDETVYGSDPREAARRWEAEGAERLHVVDLDAAILGKPQPDTVAAVIAARRALDRAGELDAPLSEQLRIRLGRGMSPHPIVHRRRDEDEAVVREGSLRQHIVGKAVRKLGERVRGQRRDHEKVGPGQVRIGALVGRPVRERREGLSRDEALRPPSHDRDHLVSGTDEPARQLTGLVGSNTTGYAEEHERHADILPTRASALGGLEHSPPEPGFARREAYKREEDDQTAADSCRLRKHASHATAPQGGGSRGNQGFPRAGE